MEQGCFMNEFSKLDVCWFCNEIPFSQRLQESGCAAPTADGKSEIQNSVRITPSFSSSPEDFFTAQEREEAKAYFGVHLRGANKERYEELHRQKTLERRAELAADDWKNRCLPR